MLRQRSVLNPKVEVNIQSKIGIIKVKIKFKFDYFTLSSAAFSACSLARARALRSILPVLIL